MLIFLFLSIGQKYKVLVYLHNTKTTENMLVVLEGLDGAGKSTQTSKLREYLQQKLGDLTYIHFPRYDAPVYGDLVSRFLRGEFGALDTVHPQLVALLFAEDRHGASPEMKKALASGGNILLDRYVYSNIAYQCAKLTSEDEAESLRKWIIDTEYGIFDIPRPDLNIFLDVPISFVEKNLSSERKEDDGRTYLDGGKDIHEASIEFQKRVRAMYRRQASLDPSFICVDCSDAQGAMADAETIFSRIKAVVDSHLEK